LPNPSSENSKLTTQKFEDDDEKEITKKTRPNRQIYTLKRSLKVPKFGLQQNGADRRFRILTTRWENRKRTPRRQCAKFYVCGSAEIGDGFIKGKMNAANNLSLYRSKLLFHVRCLSLGICDCICVCSM